MAMKLSKAFFFLFAAAVMLVVLWLVLGEVLDVVF